MPNERLSREQQDRLLSLLLAQQGFDTLRAPTIQRRDRSRPALLSFAQQRLWFLDELEPDNVAYNLPLAARIAGSLRAGTVETALNAIVRRHEALRTTVDVVEGQPLQAIALELTLPLRVEDLTAIPEGEREDVLQRRMTAEVQEPFNLRRGPLIRAVLFRLASEEHVLVLTLHHIISDAWSTGVLLRELRELMEAAFEERAPVLPELPIQYSDFAVWQRQWLEGRVLEEQLAYWKHQLAGAPTVLELPLDQPREAVRVMRGARHWYKLPKSLVARLGSLSAGEGATLFMTLLAAFQALLCRYSGQEDVVVGTPVANRNRAEVERLIGFFVNMLALRTDLSGDPTFRELLRRVRQVTLEAYDHQDLPFDRLVEELQIGRDLSHSPVFQVMFALQNVPQPPQEFAGTTWTLLPADAGAAQFDLSFMLWETEEGAIGLIEYSTDIFREATIAAMAGHYQTLLESIASAPDQRLSELPLLTESERQKIVLGWNDTRVDYPLERCLHQWIEEQAERTPEAIAVICEAGHLSYAELNRRANQLARGLRKLGVGPETLVGIFTERSHEMVIGVLGILKAGGAYVPLDPDYPADRLAYMVENAGLSVALTQERLLQRLPQHEGLRTICLDRDWSHFAGESGLNLACTTSPDALAYVIYTSGSTGKPKGAMNAHRGICNRLLWMQEAYGLAPADRVLQKTPLSFDVSVWEVFWPLMTGAALVLARPGGHRDSGYLVRLIAAEGITTIHFVPSMLQAFLEEAGLDQCASLRRVICSGEALPADLQDRFFSRLKAELHNLYGPTEAAVDVSYWACRPGPARSVPIGRPIANVTLYILDRHGNPVPVGVPGELYIGGIGVGQGYYNRPDLTAERFVPDRFSGKPGARLYRTGDLVRFLADGNIEYLGRLDHQVKIRGFRIELGEIESVLAQHPAVREAVVMAREDLPGDRRLVAYVVPQRDAHPEPMALRGHLQSKLPDYMIPATFVLLEAMPLNPNGKLDRKALPAPNPVVPEADTYVAPRTPVQELLAGIWAEVLGLERVGLHDHFFGLGGHSLIATRAMTRIRQAFQVELPLRSLFEAPTVAAMAPLVEAARKVEGPQAGIAPGTAPVAEPPLSFGQQRLWLIDQLQPGSALYNIPLTLRLFGPVQTEALATALNGIVRRHDVLRTTFAAVGGQPVQRVHPPVALPFRIDDVSSSPSEQREALVERLAAQEAQAPFDLGRGPLIRVALFRLDETDHLLVVTFHHIVCDGWSLGVFLTELQELYEAAESGREAALAPLPVRYADYSVWQRAWLRGGERDRQMCYWRERLAGAPAVLELPSDRPRPAVRSYRGGQFPFALPRGLARDLSKLSRQEGVTLFMTLLAAFKVLLSRYTAQSDILIGTPVANRNQARTEGLIGFFVNTLVIRTDLCGNPTFRELLHRVREVTLEAYDHQDLPFEQLVGELGVERHLSHSPLFQVAFVLQNTPMPALSFAGLTVTPTGITTGTAKFDLTLSLQEADGQLEGVLEYSTDLFDEATAIRIAGHYQKLLEGAAARPDCPIGDLPLLTEAEHRLQAAWNETTVPYPLDQCFHEQFAAQAGQNPEAPAVIYPGGCLTYSELDRRSNQLARYLRRLGVMPEAMVGLCLGRDPETFVGILGILKAGGVYVPLDPAYPKDRLAYMMATAGLEVLVTQSGLLDALPPHSCRTVCLDRDIRAFDAESTDALPGAPAPDDLAYVIFTSGSTGQPKGVMVPHRGLANLTAAQRETFQAGPGSLVLHFAPLSFDASIGDLVLALGAGAALCIPPDEAALPGPDLVRYLQETRITHAKFPPSVLAAMPEAALPDLRTLLVGGEACPGDIVGRWSAGRRLYNLYGPTEASVRSTATPPLQVQSAPPIGRPLANVRVHILDAHLNPVPIGVIGEIHIGGSGLARGYLGRPDLTAERFIPDPFSGDPGARLYRTGDYGRYLPDGSIDFTGRRDDQVKVRGFRIELGEIESALRKCPGVIEAVAVVREHVPGDRRIVAYVVLQEVNGQDGHTLRDSLKGSMPEYMIPSAVVCIPAIPLTLNGKVDRSQLPSPEGYARDTEVAYVEAEDEVQELIVSIWRDVLQVEAVGVLDNFFDLGGNSLLLVRVHSRLVEAFGSALTVLDLFRYPTVSELARHIGGGSTGETPAWLDIAQSVGERRKQRREQRSRRKTW